MVVRICGEWLAVPAAALEQVVDVRPVHVVPGRSNRSFRGLVNVDGALLLCYSGARLLGLEEEEAPRRMLVAAHGGERIVLPVDEALGVRRVENHALQEPPATVEHSPSTMTKAVFQLDERHVGLLDVGRLFECARRSLM
jgi:chemotaxis-related protein WspD